MATEGRSSLERLAPDVAKWTPEWQAAQVFPVRYRCTEEDNRRHDLVTKRDEYARAGIPEYWIVDTQEATITIFVLKPRRKSYVEHGTFQQGDRAASKLLPGFGVDVTETISQKP